MAKPAAKALARIQERHPAATILERHASSLVCDVGGGKRALVSQIGAMHYQPNPGDPWAEIDTAWQAAAGAWQYEMLNGPYLASARDTLNAGQVLEYKARSGEWVRLQPLALNWRDENNSQQQIAVPQAVATQVSGVDSDVLSWPNGYGPGRDFSWSAHPTRLQKLLTVQAASDLPAPAGYLGAGVELELTFAFTFDASVTAFVDGVAWNRSTTATTGSAIEFRSSTGETLWHFTAPRAWDSEGTETTGVMSFYRQGNTRHVAVRIPRAFVDAAVFPLYLDPTVTVTADTAAANDNKSRNDVWQQGFNAPLRCYFLSPNRNFSLVRWAVAIPNMAIVTTAEITVVANATWTTTPTGNDARFNQNDNSPEVSSGTIYGSMTWGDAVTWDFDAKSAGATMVSPNLAQLVQDIIDRVGWSSGNYMGVRIWPAVTNTDTNITFAAYGHASYDPPSLYVEYAAGDQLTLTPNGHVSVSGIVDQAAGTTNLHLAVDETIGSTDGDTTYLVNNANSDGNVVLELTATPSDFDTMNAIRITLRVRRE